MNHIFIGFIYLIWLREKIGLHILSVCFSEYGFGIRRGIEITRIDPALF